MKLLRYLNGLVLLILLLMWLVTGNRPSDLYVAVMLFLHAIDQFTEV